MADELELLRQLAKEKNVKTLGEFYTMDLSDVSESGTAPAVPATPPAEPRTTEQTNEDDKDAILNRTLQYNQNPRMQPDRGSTAQRELQEFDNRPRTELTLDSALKIGAAALRQVNVGVNVGEWINNIGQFPADPNFDMREYYDVLVEDVPHEYRAEVARARSLDEAMYIKERIALNAEDAQTLSSAGVPGTVAMLAAGLVDVDTLLSFGVAKPVTGAARIAQAAKLAAATGAVNTAMEVGLQATNYQNGDWSNLPTAFLLGAGAGGLIGFTGFGARKVLGEDQRGGINVGMRVEDVAPEEGMQDALRWSSPDAFRWGYENPRVELNVNQEALARQQAMHRMAEDFQENAFDPDFQAKSNLHEQPAHEYPTTAVFNPGEAVEGVPQLSLTERSRAFIASLPGAQTARGWTKKFQESLNRRLPDDYNRAMQTKSPTLQAWAHSMLESSEGQARNNHSGALIREHMLRKTIYELEPAWDEAFNTWAASRGYGLTDKWWTNKAAKEFDREWMLAMNDLNFGKIGLDQLSPELQKIVRASEKFSDTFLREARSASPRTAVAGFENVKKRGVYFPLRWSGRAMRDLETKLGRKRLAQIVARAYAITNPDMTADDAAAIGKALVRRISKKGTEVDTNLASLLRGDGKVFLEEALADEGMSAERIQQLIARYLGAGEDKGKAGYARHRTPMDLSLEIDGVKIVDMVEPDMLASYRQYADTMSKKIALARHGINSRDAEEYIKNTILDEDPTIDRAWLEGVFSYFQAGAPEGGLEPTVRRIRAATNLALLNKLGLTQAGETGAILATAGVKNFIAASPVLAKALKKAPMGATVIDDIKWMAGNLGYEKNMVRFDMLQEMQRGSTPFMTDLGRKLDEALAKGQQAQQFLSGYRTILRHQTDVAAKSVTNKLFKELRDGVKSEAALNDMGFDAGFRARLQKYIENGTVKFNADGELDALQPNLWKRADQEEFGRVITRTAYQLIQRELPGEGYRFMHTNFGALILHLQSFPILAMRKQFIRINKLADGTATRLFLYGLGTATLAAAARAVIDGEYDKLNPRDLAKRAFSYANYTGWIPTFTDPIATMTGLDSLKMYGSKYEQNILQVPSVDTMNRVLRIPRALAPDGDFTKSDKYALSALPIVGNMYLMNRVLDSMLTENKDKVED